MTSGDRLVSGAYLATQTRPWRHEDALPNQGHLDTSVPARAVDLDAIRRATERRLPPTVEDWLADRYALPRPTVRHAPRVPLRRRLTPIGRAAWWVVEHLPALTGIVLVGLLVAAYLRGATP